MSTRSILAVALLAASGCHSTADNHKPDPELAHLQKQVGEFEHQLAAIRRAVPAAANVEDRACPDDALAEKLHGATGKLLLAEYEYLGRYAGGSADDRGRWKVLTTPALRQVPLVVKLSTTAQATDALFRIRKLQQSHPWIAVLRTSHRELPHMDGKRYHPGALSGGLFIFDLASGKPLCQAGVDVHSSGEVAGVQGQPPASALWNDFVLQLQQELDRSLSRVTKQLELDRG